MKKKIIYVAIILNIIVVGLCVNGTSVHASDIHYTEESIQEDMMQKSSIAPNENALIKDKREDIENGIITEGDAVRDHLTKKHPSVNSNSWFKSASNSTEKITGNITVEMKGKDFPEAIIKDGIQQLKAEGFTLETSYGGCGPIATMGIVEYFARTFPYYNIGYNSYIEKLRIVKYILSNTRTYQFGNSTFSHPYDCVVGFNNAMERYELGNTIVATDQGYTKSQEEKVAKVKEQIDKGLPVTMYALFAGEDVGENIGNHYVNIYGYQEWEGYDDSGNHFANTIFVICPNWKQDGYISYVDANILFSRYTGIIYYDITYNEQKLTSHDFSEFVNINDQGQYFNDAREQEITLSNNFCLNTKRLRCSFIENEYLVLSAIKKDGTYVYNEKQEAYLEMDLNDNLQKIEFDLALWSFKEKFTAESELRFEYKRSGSNTWQTDERHSINLLLLPSKESFKHFIFYMPYNDIIKIRFILTHPKVVADRNKGRVVINNIDLCFDNHNQPITLPHTHQYNNLFVSNDSETHTAYCICGESQVEPHVFTVEDGSIKCIFCDYEYTTE